MLNSICLRNVYANILCITFIYGEFCFYLLCTCDIYVICCIYGIYYSMDEAAEFFGAHRNTIIQYLF